MKNVVFAISAKVSDSMDGGKVVEDNNIEFAGGDLEDMKAVLISAMSGHVELLDLIEESVEGAKRVRDKMN